MDSKTWTIQYLPAGLSFSLTTNSQEIERFFILEYGRLLVHSAGSVNLTITESRSKAEIPTFICVFPNGSMAETEELSTALYWLINTIKKECKANDWWPFHGGLVMNKDSRTAIICGSTGAGKTTLCVYMAQHGWRCFGDDLIWVNKCDMHISPMPLGFNVRDDVIKKNYISKATSSMCIPSISGEVRWVLPNETEFVDQEGSKPSLIIECCFNRIDGTSITKLSTIEALNTLLLNSYSSAIIPTNIAMSVELVKQIPVYRLCYSNCGAGMIEIEQVIKRLS